MMNEPWYDTRTFSASDLSGQRPETREFTGCAFVDCNFAESDFSSINFADCTFDRCNLGLVKLTGTSLKNVSFTACKLIGADFSTCNDLLLSLTFEKCNLELAYFGKMKLKNTRFEECSIREANFTDTDLAGSSFLLCDLTDTLFDHTILHGVDFRTAFNYCLDPESNRLKNAKFSYPGVCGLLRKYQIEIE